MVIISMRSVSDERERKAVFADLKAEYLYVLIPFVLLVGIKLYSACWKEGLKQIFLSADWSLISCVVFGQVTFKMSKAVAATKHKTNNQFYGFYTAKRFFWVVVAAAFYFGMVSKPTLGLGIAQIFLFLLATYFHFSDGYAVYMLQKVSQEKR